MIQNLGNNLKEIIQHDLDNKHTSERRGRGGRADSSNRKPYLETHNGGSWAGLMAKWNADKIIGSTTPGSSHRGSRSLPGQCGPENMRYSWSSHVNNKYSFPLQSTSICE